MSVSVIKNEIVTLKCFLWNDWFIICMFPERVIDEYAVVSN